MRPDSLVTLLSDKDHERLRAITRRIHVKHFPDEPLSDIACDHIINNMGPQAVERLLKAGVDSNNQGSAAADKFAAETKPTW
jgi:hypothetical protein